MKKTRRQFTLVEILVVLIIVCILLRLLAPMLSDFIVGNAIDYGAQSFKSYCQQARVYAAEHQQNVSVIIVASLDDAEEKPMTTDQIFTRTAYRAGFLKEKQDGSGAYDHTEVTWVPKSKWMFLPEGAYVRRTAGKGETDNAWNNLLLSRRQSTKNALIITDKESGNDVLYHVFVITYTPSGELINGARIWLAQGVVNQELESLHLNDAEHLDAVDEENANMLMLDFGRVSRRIDIISPEDERWIAPPSSDDTEKEYKETFGSGADQWNNP